MRRPLALLLCLYLLVWAPLSFAVELLSVLPSLGLRGPAAVAELALHGVLALLCAVAGRMVWAGAPAARSFASAAVAAAGVASLQSIFWSSLPRDIAPGNHLPLAVVSASLAAVLLIAARKI